ncbi:caspase family protein [Wenjunlia tyrosinilytica]|uniref:Peptidase C14 caspase domain-containing protein n=1 Tax=Wenjunlia tyrosinilytica TaxID=1544741 RepID=A0A917ZSD9_9ACTN|nr:caspase family protein [Wenjunlia tyrosinilytica]GGO88874.1 hypothetical protein GCM10012280_30700 [Wenjunlia tyrosinilytica]
MPTGLSIHIGLNAVDPARYEGWDGELIACEQDAQDMAQLAKNSGFTVTPPLLTADATAKRVTAALREAAGSLKKEDVLLLTYSGHGGQVEDLNGPEDEPDRLDETWVLHDRQFVDDELFALLGTFAAGVRILVFSDSCHSGSVVKEVPQLLSPAALERQFQTQDAAEVEKRIRVMPLKTQAKVNKRDKKLYDGIQAEQPAKDAADIAASILLISGCQDCQTSADGLRNGLFTSKLLETWNGGHFKGGYRAFHRQIMKKMPMNQIPNLLRVGHLDSAFLRQTPFTI